MSTLNTTTSSTRPSLGTGDAGKSYYETDSRKILVWDGVGFNEYNKDATIYPALANHYGIILDGTDDYLDIGVNGDIAELSSASALSFCYWVKFHTVASLEVVTSTGLNSGDRFATALQAGNIDVYFGASAYLNGTVNVPLNTWTHVAVFKNGTNASLYINGSLDVSTTSAPATTDVDAGKNMRIGSSPNFAGYYVDGEFDEVALWGSDQSSNIGSIYTGTTPANLTSLNPDHWWRMGDGDSGTGTTVTDDGNASTLVDGTLTNGAAFQDLSTAPDSIYVA
jgi:hypothetical protein